MRLPTTLALAAGLALGAGCGSEGTIPSGDAQRMRDTLDRVAAAIDAGECGRANARVDVLRQEVEGLAVPARLRRNLAEGVRKLDAAASRDCEDAQQDEPVETTTVETTTVTAPTDTTPTTTTTTPETTTTTTTPPQTTPTTPTTTPEPPTGGVPPGEGDAGGAGGDEG